ncbi:hypothetical protein ACIHDR_24655 [Nocardia sp. NPDC052278]|uniref:hypothetical protein n=1 Tax=unclassified Nocardia TaxID=2637762 RepID=UPI00369C67FD
MTKPPTPGFPTPRSPKCLAPFVSKAAHRTDGNLIVRRVKRLNRKAAAQGAGELFATYRYHALFTDSPFPLLRAEPDHRGHAVVEQVFADLIDGP